MENRKDVTVPMPAELDDAIKQQLDYGDSRAEWIREAIRMRLEAEAAAGERDIETDGGQAVLAD